MTLIRQTFFQWIYALLKSVLPDRTKRLIMISSLAARLKNADELDSRFLMLLNAHLSLCHLEEALKFPIAINRSIWPVDLMTLCGKCDCENEEECKHLANQLYSLIPSWLRYSSDLAMINDLRSLLRFEHAFLSFHP